MNKINSIIVAFATMLMFSSCSSTFYQVYQVEAEQMEVTDNAIIFENDDCTVLYDLWANGGNMSFLFTNKTDNSIYLVMSESFYIQNGEAHDYFKEGSETVSKGYSVGEATAASATLLGSINAGLKWYNGSVAAAQTTKKGMSVTKSVTNINQEIICIPPHSSKYITSFSILNKVQYVCDAPNLNYPKKTATIGTFNKKSDSPLTFRNRIAYTTNPKSQDFHYIDNSFWVSSYTNYKEKAATEKIKVDKCNTTPRKTINSNGIEMKVFKINNAHSFYNTYKKN